MAKINGVFEFTGESAIEVNGERYELIEGQAKKGDIAKIVTPWGSVVKGAFYPVINEDHFMYHEGMEDEFVFIDGERMQASGYLHRVLVFRKVVEFKKGDKVRLVSGGGEYPLIGFYDGETYEVMAVNVPHPNYGGNYVKIERYEPYGQGYAEHMQLELVEEPEQVEETPEYKTEKRHAKVGERILIVEDLSVGEQTYKEGDILTVTAEHDLYDGDVFVAEQPRLIISDEYEVIVEDEGEDEQAPFKVGDIVKFDESRFGGPVGYGKVLEGPEGILRGGNYEIDSGDSTYIVLGNDLTLVAKAEDRADKE